MLNEQQKAAAKSNFNWKKCNVKGFLLQKNSNDLFIIVVQIRTSTEYKKLGDLWRNSLLHFYFKKNFSAVAFPTRSKVQISYAGTTNGGETK